MNLLILVVAVLGIGFAPRVARADCLPTSTGKVAGYLTASAVVHKVIGERVKTAEATAKLVSKALMKLIEFQDPQHPGTCLALSRSEVVALFQVEQAYLSYMSKNHLTEEVSKRLTELIGEAAATAASDAYVDVVHELRLASEKHD